MWKGWGFSLGLAGGIGGLVSYRGIVECLGLCERGVWMLESVRCLTGRKKGHASDYFFEVWKAQTSLTSLPCTQTSIGASLPFANLSHRHTRTDTRTHPSVNHACGPYNTEARKKRETPQRVPLDLPKQTAHLPLFPL